jgi:hypothetical protein
MVVTHLGKTDFRNSNQVFGIKTDDRFSHIHIIGKTGTGKSTLIEGMALQDLERGRGFALLDLHGDLVERVAARARKLGMVSRSMKFGRIVIGRRFCHPFNSRPTSQSGASVQQGDLDYDFTHFVLFTIFKALCVISNTVGSLMDRLTQSLIGIRNWSDRPDPIKVSVQRTPIRL